jgi:hypothetical protein
MCRKVASMKNSKMFMSYGLQVSVGFMTVLSNAVKSVTIKGILDLM